MPKGGSAVPEKRCVQIVMRMVGQRMAEKKLTFNDLCPKHFSQRSDTISGTGKNRVLGYRTGVACEAGNIEIDEWRKLMLEHIHRAGEEELHEQLKVYVQAEYPWCKTKAKIKLEALELHAMRVFDNEKWVGFIRFNRQFRPEVLDSIQLVQITTVCCKSLAATTLAQVQNARRQSAGICCPICGRWSDFEEVSNL